MIKKLIINADDFGLTEGITKGIIDCHADGVLTSTTLLINAPFTNMALNMAQQCPRLGVGIHLNATLGRPLVSGKKSFTDAYGQFVKVTEYPLRNVEANPKELYMEWKAQIELFIALANKLPTHVDSHHHVHMNPVHHEAVLKLTQEYDLPVRQTSRHHSQKINTDYEDAYFYGDFYGDSLSMKSITDVFDLDKEIVEIMCHPAYLDQATYDSSNYRLPRMTEMKILRSQELRRFVKEAGIELINYADLVKSVK